MIVFAFLQMAAAAPSFDCGRARGLVERAICASPELAALDREEARLYRLALAQKPGERRRLVARQRGFLQMRAECVRDEAVAGECIRDAYQQDIADLRRTEGLAGDADGLSSGPVRYRCDGGYPDAYVTRFRLEPAQAWVSVPALNEGQPLAAVPVDYARLVGRYDTGQLLTADGRELRINARVCR